MSCMSLKSLAILRCKLKKVRVAQGFRRVFTASGLFYRLEQLREL